jgi:hypothetical protein
VGGGRFHVFENLCGDDHVGAFRQTIDAARMRIECDVGLRVLGQIGAEIARDGGLEKTAVRHRTATKIDRHQITAARCDMARDH